MYVFLRTKLKRNRKLNKVNYSSLVILIIDYHTVNIENKISSKYNPAYFVLDVNFCYHRKNLTPCGPANSKTNTRRGGQKN